MRAVAASLLLIAATTARADEPTPAAAYYKDFTRLGIVDPKTGSPDALDAELALAEQALERGDFAAAASMLYGIVDSPRFADFGGSVAYQNAEYDIIVALAAGGASNEAMTYVERILRRGPKAQYFAVAHRRAVDIGIATRRYADVLARLEKVPVAGQLPVEAESERGYLRGRQAYEDGKLDDAEKLLAQVSRKSRLYSSAVYLRGVIRVRQGKLGDATDAFCEIAQTPEGDRYAFFIDERYWPLKDLARLGAARVAHEQGRFDDAYYHYFQIPDDSERLPEALFEAAWSMYQKRELRTARELVSELQKDFPTSPMATEAMLLAGYIELADCKFDVARQRFDALAADVRLLVDTIVKARATREARLALLHRALAGQAPAGATPEDRVLGMLRLDPRLKRLHEQLLGLQRELALAPRVIDSWQELALRLPGAKVAPAAGDALALLTRIRRTRQEIVHERLALLAAGGEDATARLPALDKADAQLAAIEDKVAAAAPAAAGADPALLARLQQELKATRELESRATALARAFDDAADDVGGKELLRLHTQLVRIFEKARLGRIDAVIGEKRRYEKEIEDLAHDRWQPPIAKAYKQGLIGDKEEYWPPEEEVWDDEYEGYK
jgi:hypothetical protein